MLLNIGFDDMTWPQLFGYLDGGISMHAIITIGLDRKSRDELMALLEVHDRQEVVDIRTDEERQATGYFRETELAASLRQKSMQYLTLSGMLAPQREASVQAGAALAAAVSLVCDQAEKYRIAFIGNGQDPDAVFGETTLIAALLERGVSVELMAEDGSLAPITVAMREASQKKRSSRIITQGMIMVAASAMTVTVLGIALYPGSGTGPGGSVMQAYEADGRYVELMISNIDSNVAYDRNGVPYRRMPDGRYEPMTENEPAAASGSSGGSSGGGGGHGYWDYRREGESFRNGTAQPGSRVSIARGGFGSSSAAHSVSSSVSSHASSGGAHASGASSGG